MPYVFALNDLVHIFPRPNGFISTDNIKRMSQENLEKVRDDLNASIVALRVIIRRKDNQGIPFNKISSLARFQTQEAVEALITVLREEIKRMQAQDYPASREVFLTTLSALGTIGAKFPRRYVENMIDLAQEFEAKAKANGASEIIIKKMDNVIDVMESREENLVDLNDLLHAIEMATNQPTIVLERTEKILRAGLTWSARSYASSYGYGMAQLALRQGSQIARCHLLDGTTRHWKRHSRRDFCRCLKRRQGRAPETHVSFATIEKSF